MNNSKIGLQKTLPVFMSFIVMGFVDIVGVATGFIKKDFGLTDDLAQLIPSMALFWFFVLSVPSGILQDKFGKRRMLNIGMLLTGFGMVIPFIHYSFPVMLVAFIVLGIGNTIVQVSANPLLHDVAPREKYSSYMSLSQFIKAIVSLLGPVITTLMATMFGNWKLVFAVYAFTSVLAIMWLYFTQIEETKSSHGAATFKSCFSLLKNKFIVVMVLGIFMLVGADVGMNSNIANFLQNQFGLTLERASLGISLYFTALMIGRFLGAVILNWISARRFLLLTALVALISLVGMLVAPSVLMVQVAIFMVGLGSGNLFPLIFSIAIEKMPDRSNEVSGLMIMAVSGGAFLPPLMGMVSTNIGVKASFLVLVMAMIYLVSAGIYALKK
ncbi:MAG: MFS transporter [Bacteroidales bacterium]|nr:MFS transporter [Bacteroidales bacterium]MDP3002540.1 MFS transporter [Bacteroidales bacterium]